MYLIFNGIIVKVKVKRFNSIVYIYIYIYIYSTHFNYLNMYMKNNNSFPRSMEHPTAGVSIFNYQSMSLPLSAFKSVEKYSNSKRLQEIGVT